MQRFVLNSQQGASNRTPRQINRNLIFNLIRRHQPVSRADLARISGLQRSTVSLIVEDLIADRWILEGQLGRLPRGRRPTYLTLNEQRAVIALDIHPAASAIAVVEIGGRIIEQRSIEVPQNSTDAVNILLDSVRRLIASYKGKPFDGIGICLPGRTNPQRDETAFAPNLPWPVQHLRSRIAKATGLRVEMENVATACALAEMWFREGAVQNDLVVVNVSEGIGTGIFANGQLLLGDNGMAGEFGHVPLVADGPLCGCGNHGCWETLASNRAALRYYRESGGIANPETFEALLTQLKLGDSNAVTALKQMGTQLGRGLRMIATVLAPAEIVIVGEVTLVWHIVGPVAEAEMRCGKLVPKTMLRPAYDGATARLRSAVALIFSAEAL